MTTIHLSIIIPAYNEQDRIVETLTHTLAWLERQDFKSEVVVVSDGSHDQTCRVVCGFDQGSKTHIRAVEYFPNRGKGYAVKFGMLQGQGQVIMFMDADYCVPVDFVATGLELIQAGCDVAIASRAIAGATVSHHQNIFREASAKLYTFIQNRYLGLHYKDTQCGFKLFKRKAAQALFGQQKLDSVIFDPEILWLAKRDGFRVAEFPIRWRHVENSRIQYDSLRKSLFVFQELFRIRRLH